MQQKIINILEGYGSAVLHADSGFSFKPFIDYLKLRLQKNDFVKEELLVYILNKFEAFDGMDEEVNEDKYDKYKELFDLLFVVLTNLTENEKQIFWGLGLPMTPIMIYGSDGFYNLMEEANAYDIESGIGDKSHEQFMQTRLEFFYAFILDRLYSIQLPKKRNIIRTIKDIHSGLSRHYSINLNTDFVTVNTKRELPPFDIENLHKYALTNNTLIEIQKLLPIDMFSFSGFTIMTVTDVTDQYALETIRDNIVKNETNTGSYNFPDIVQALKELTGSNDIEFNILPLFKVNGKLAEDMETYNRSILFSAAQKNRLTDSACFSMMNKFVSLPELFYFSDLDTEIPLHREEAKLLKAEDIKSYTLIPFFYNNKLVGAIESFSKVKGLINDRMLGQMEIARELLAQLMYNAISSIEFQIEKVIKERYTKLQPAVQWKFVEAGWHYLQSRREASGLNIPEAAEIDFREVYPLYGAVDIRNSTVMRNMAMLNDNVIQLNILLKVLHDLKTETGFGLIDEKIFATTDWINLIEVDNQEFNQQVKLNDFLVNTINPFLEKFTYSRPELNIIVQEYFDAIDENNGAAHKNRRSLENSMSRVISFVNNYFEQMKGEIQEAYPCYFEKFRSDGVEYDIYIGQSISPDIIYNDIYLKNLRLKQLTSMATIAKNTNALMQQLTNPVETTQLIFIHSQPIDILFRSDEKRFDVEGAYNIRYHIIKKRIDKVLLKGTNERLTQPGKIALVYFNETDVNEYISYIKYLQAENILNDDLEKLELEELNDVSGIKALRVGVNLG